MQEGTDGEREKERGRKRGGQSAKKGGEREKWKGGIIKKREKRGGKEDWQVWGGEGGDEKRRISVEKMRGEGEEGRNNKEGGEVGKKFRLAGVGWRRR